MFFAQASIELSNVLTPYYSSSLVLLSGAIAILASMVTVYLSDVSRGLQSPASQKILFVIGGVAFGITVWAVHMIGMLAFALHTPVSHYTGLSILSMIPAIVAGYILLFCLNQHQRSFQQTLLGGLMVGVGIGMMHYAIMLAMQVDASMQFLPVPFIVSMLAMVMLATVIIPIPHRITQWNMHGIRGARYVIAGMLLGLVMVSMHYLGMTSVIFTGAEQSSTPLPAQHQTFMLMLILGAVFATLSIALLLGFLFKQQASLLHLQRQHQELLLVVEESIDAILIINGQGYVTYANPAAHDLFGYQDLCKLSITTLLPTWKKHAADRRKSVTETIGKHFDQSELQLRVAAIPEQGEAGGNCSIFLMDISQINEMHTRLESAALHDALTGLHNRGYFNQEMKQVYDAAVEGAYPLAVLMLDIDHFKFINDQYGHYVGDIVLMRLANTLKSSVRKTDVVARYGGEEFVIILPRTPALIAEAAAESIREQVGNMAIPLDGSHDLRLTVSIGIAAHHRNNSYDSAYALMQGADHALYQAKESGRNCVVLHHAD